ncbi:putative mRNA-capping enzyme [Pyramimonas orientalis virus]|uniref:mRNA-capping enzyme n=1 Tax=Pyramimonas orientalis virus 01B TaxID=3134525 RepID=A0A7M4CER6_9VIRU|nr:putative mRNA-capping enzyme [Pyramimonas orientalis virus]QOI90174.1 putative mRNA-capping enzyme [Pyramimonas orientalis virus]
MELSKSNYELVIKSLTDANANVNYEFECVFSHKDLNKQKFTELLNYLSKSKQFDLIKSIHRESLDISLLNTNYRVSIEKQPLIVDFCKTGYLSEFSILKKSPITNNENIKLLEYDIYFKIKNEQVIDNVENFSDLFANNDKFFRNKKRFSFNHSSGYFRVDLTIVKSSKNVSKSIQYSGVLSAKDKFEIEIEYLNDVGKTKKQGDVVETLFNIIEIIQKVLDDTDFVITNSQKEQVIIEYLNLVNPKVFLNNKTDLKDFIHRNVLKKPKSFFLSYQPVTLEQTNLLESDLGKLSIKDGYSVTEKADGERMLLYVDNNNNVFMMDSRLTVRSVGVKHKYANSLIDGEFVKRSKHNTVLNHFMAFDIYFMNNKDVRSTKLIPTRYDTLKDFCKTANSQFVINPKTYHYDDDIFKLSKKVYNKDKYVYHIDGLIYTPINLNVGAYYKEEESNTDTFGGTWMSVMKWKPPDENSVDMLSSYGEELFVPNVGRCVLCNLQVAYRTDSDELIDPFKVLTNTTIISKTTFIKKTFVQVYLKIRDGDKKPKTKMNEPIYNNTIVEYVYDETQDELLSWVPYRVRYDKTDLYQKTNNIMGTANSYVTALNVWRSIQNPVTTNMITGVDTLNAGDVVENDVYYARNVNRMKILSKPILSFHNKGVKSRLFALFKNKNYTLVDLACGKAGDLYKWIENRYSFVVGFDINLDNIMNSNDGAYKRYYQVKQQSTTGKMNAIFIQKDVSKHWADTDQIDNKSMKELYDIAWGNTLRKDVTNIQMLKYYNVMQSKFDVVSCQFAIHYMFADEDTLDRFCANVNKVMKVGSYFMGTCLDGARVNDFLSVSSRKMGKINDNVVWMLEKKYETYKKNKTGQTISVYLESINRVIDEYLVDFDLLQSKFEQYDIKVLTPTDLKKLDIKASINNFKEWHNDKEYTLPDVLKEYSFLNSWFIFKKY